MLGSILPWTGAHQEAISWTAVKAHALPCGSYACQSPPGQTQAPSPCHLHDLPCVEALETIFADQLHDAEGCTIGAGIGRIGR